MSREVAEIANRYMSDPVEITVGSRNAGAENVSHEYYVVRHRDRYAALKRILDNAPDIYSIIFCRTRMDTQEIADKLLQDGYKADALHGDLTQAQRDLVMRKFHSRHLQILVATDVAARGLDVNDLTHVINYTLPDDIASYTHRSGRTGRAGRTGISAVLADTREMYKIRQIEHRLKKQFSRCPIPQGEEICRKQLASLIKRISQAEVRHEQIEPLFADIAKQLEALDKEDLIKKIISLEFNRFLEYYKNAPDLNPSMENRRRGERERTSRKPLHKDFDNKRKNFARFHLNVGRRDGLLPEYLVGRINEVPGGGRIKVGKIEIMRNTATLEGDSRFIPQILNTFQQAEVNGKPVNIRLMQDSDRPVRRNGGRPENRKKFRRLREQHR
jgi:ATP-dependent RNA helicase DeaD